MQIAEARVQMTAAHQLREEQVHEESLQIWSGARPPEGPPESAPNQDSLTISYQARELQASATAAPTAEEAGVTLDPKLLALQRVIEMLTGKKITLGHMAPLSTESAPVPTEPRQEGLEPAGWGLAYDATTTTIEEETTRFTARGTIVTIEGRRIDFDLQLAMQRQHIETSAVSIRAGDARLVDPLVINFDGTAAQLTNLQFDFDLDADGKKEAMPFVGSGKGFLVLDRNHDGQVNNGAELFGPATGNGFAELAALDDDHNGWLDEADPLYSQLRIWTKDTADSEHLWSLADKGIGALLLTGTASPFSLKDPTNELLGAIRETSIFVREDGTVGTVQELDIAV